MKDILFSHLLPPLWLPNGDTIFGFVQRIYRNRHKDEQVEFTSPWSSTCKKSTVVDTQEDPMADEAEVKLTERELMIARKAAELAVIAMEQRFYESVGKNIVSRGLTWLGVIVVAFAAGKGYIKLP